MQIFKSFLLLKLAFIVTGSLALAGGIVGNGAGLAEQNVQFAYLSLAKIITNCKMTSKLCALTDEELHILFKIERVINKNSSNPNRIIFSSERLHPGFFTTSSLENNRIAKTGLSPEYPIYFNVDELYNLNGSLTLDFSGISAILIHEIGHQTGEVSHAKLDILGSKIRSVLSQNYEKFHYEFPANQNHIELDIINYSMPIALADMYISVNSQPNQILTKDILKQVKCKSSKDSFMGYSIVNGHWSFVHPEFDNSSTGIDFSAWVRIYCGDTSIPYSVMGTEIMNIAVHISNQGKVLGIEVKALR